MSGVSPSTKNSLKRLSRRANCRSLRFLGIRGEILTLLFSSVYGSDGGPKEAGRSCRYEVKRSDFLSTSGEDLCKSTASLVETLRGQASVRLACDCELFTLSEIFEEKLVIDFRLSSSGEHGADLDSFFITGNLSLLVSKEGSFVVELAASRFELVLARGVNRFNFSRSFFASKFKLFVNWFCSFCMETLIFSFVLRRIVFRTAQFLSFAVRREEPLVFSARSMFLVCRS